MTEIESQVCQKAFVDTKILTTKSRNRTLYGSSYHLHAMSLKGRQQFALSLFGWFQLGLLFFLHTFQYPTLIGSITRRCCMTTVIKLRQQIAFATQTTRHNEQTQNESIDAPKDIGIEFTPVIFSSRIVVKHFFLLQQAMSSSCCFRSPPQQNAAYRHRLFCCWHDGEKSNECSFTDSLSFLKSVLRA